MAIAPADLSPDHLAFLAERHLATLTTLGPDGRPHVVPVGFSFDPAEHLVRIITFAHSTKVANLHTTPGGPAVVCQMDGGRWLSLEGRAVVTDDPARVAVAVAAYTERYRPPTERTNRVAIELTVDRVLGRV